MFVLTLSGGKQAVQMPETGSKIKLKTITNN